MPPAPKVFISYSHDSEAHRRRVLELSQRLRADDVEVQIDALVVGAPPEGWERWASKQLAAADTILLVCTEDYYRHFWGHEASEAPAADKAWAGAITTKADFEHLADKRFVPVLFHASDWRFIPEPLGVYNYYLTTSTPAYRALSASLRGVGVVALQSLGGRQSQAPGRDESTRSVPSVLPRDPSRASPSLPPRVSVRPAGRAAVGGRTSGSGNAPGAQKVGPPRLPPDTPRTFVGRARELAWLNAAWQATADDLLPRPPIVIVVGPAGAGKTTLVAHWRETLAARRFPGAEGVFEWSFHGHQSPEQAGESSDLFIRRALEFFGDPELARGNASPWDKGVRLAALVSKGKNLLLLDNVERVQGGEGQPGRVKDPALRALLGALAPGRGRSLCVLSTRQPIADLHPYGETTAPQWNLEPLSVAAGAELLLRLGVRGPLAEREAASRRFQGHALTLELLGTHLVSARAGDVHQARELDTEGAGATPAEQVKTVLRRHVAWLREQGTAGAPELALLRLFGLFDRPAELAALNALRRAPPIAGLTEPLLELGDEAWTRLLAELERRRWLRTWFSEPSPLRGYSQQQAEKPKQHRGAPEAFLPPEQEGTRGRVLEAHELVREYFASELRQEDPETFRSGHRRLYEHLQASVPYWPEGAEGLVPLFHAVKHGCKAGAYEAARADVLRDRIRRGREAYSVRKLGAFAAELSALAWFFDKPWTAVAPFLTEQVQSWLLNEAAYALRAVGRLTDALDPMRVGLELDVRLGDWKNAAISASNLSELELCFGDVQPALHDAELAVEYADRSGDTLQRISRRTRLADALHVTGRYDQALALFREAEGMQAERVPSYPRLYSVQGYRYCDLLLAPAERCTWLRQPDSTLADSCRAVIERARQTLAWATAGRAAAPTLALDHLTLGRAELYLSLLDPSVRDERSAAARELDAAVDGLRLTGQTQELPRALLARARLRSVERARDRAVRDLDEALAVAERGPMRLHLADIHLHRARLLQSRADLERARRLIDELGYERRREELADAEAAVTTWPANPASLQGFPRGDSEAMAVEPGLHLEPSPQATHPSPSRLARDEKGARRVLAATPTLLGMNLSQHPPAVPPGPAPREPAPQPRVPEVEPPAPEVTPVPPKPEVEPQPPAPDVIPTPSRPEVDPKPPAPEVTPPPERPEIEPPAPEITPVPTAPEVEPQPNVPEVTPPMAGAPGKSRA